LHGPYRAPRLRVGDRTECLLRGALVITAWTDAQISCPRCGRQSVVIPVVFDPDFYGNADRLWSRDPGRTPAFFGSRPLNWRERSY
jgi:hypothetical protein